jgi:hypothetical protein
MRRFRGIAAVLLLVLMMPLAHAYAVIAHNAKQATCCRHDVDSCCEGSAQICCVAQTPVDTSLYPAQNVMPVILPALSVPGVYAIKANPVLASSVALRSPEQHSPPGLLIAETIVLRI